MQFEWKAVFEFISSGSAPAWVQAIGSVVAIFIAIRVSRISVEHAGLLKQKTSFSIAEAAYRYGCDLRAAIALIGEEAGSNVNLFDIYHKDVLAGLVKALQSVPVHELGSSQQVLAVLGMTNQLVFLGVAVEKLLVDPSLHPELVEVFSNAAVDRKERRETRVTIVGVLKRNAITHLDKLDEHFDLLRQSLPE